MMCIADVHWHEIHLAEFGGQGATKGYLRIDTLLTQLVPIYVC